VQEVAVVVAEVLVVIEAMVMDVDAVDALDVDVDVDDTLVAVFIHMKL